MLKYIPLIMFWSKQKTIVYMYTIIERAANIDNRIWLSHFLPIICSSNVHIYINLTVVWFQGVRLSAAWHAPHDFPKLFGSSYKFIDFSRDEGWEEKQARWFRNVVYTNNFLNKRGRCSFSSAVTTALSKIEAPATCFPNHIRLT